jgi:hypothetical protein
MRKWVQEEDQTSGSESQTGVQEISLYQQEYAMLLHCWQAKRTYQ